MDITKLIEKTLCENKLTAKDIRNYKSFRVGDILIDDDGTTHRILDIYIRMSSLDAPSSYVKFEWENAQGEKDTATESVKNYLTTYFSVKK